MRRWICKECLPWPVICVDHFRCHGNNLYYPPSRPEGGLSVNALDSTTSLGVRILIMLIRLQQARQEGTWQLRLKHDMCVELK